jgi:hypothetical protein
MSHRDEDGTSPTTDTVRKHPGEDLLVGHGHDVIPGRVRVAAGRSGVAVGFPNDPLVHVSWWGLVAGALIWRHLRRRS